MNKVRLSWRKQAACIDLPPESFFPDGRPREDVKAVCKGCPVRAQCLETALSSPWPPAGIWAGMSRNQLEPLWQQRHPDGAAKEIHLFLGSRVRLEER